MAPFLYRCPNTRLQVQAWVEDAGAYTNETRETYRGERCPSCHKFHFVNPKSRKVLGVDEHQLSWEGSEFMEDNMINQSHEHHTILDAIANWVKKYREAIGLRNELANCTPEQVALIARDMGLSPGELLSVTAKGPHAADELPRLLRALGVNPQKLASEQPATMRDLQRICVNCGHKGECQHDLATGKAAGHYRDYCPNAISLDSLFHEKLKDAPG